MFFPSCFFCDHVTLVGNQSSPIFIDWKIHDLAPIKHFPWVSGMWPISPINGEECDHRSGSGKTGGCDWTSWIREEVAWSNGWNLGNLQQLRSGFLEFLGFLMCRMFIEIMSIIVWEYIFNMRLIWTFYCWVLGFQQFSSWWLWYDMTSMLTMWLFVARELFFVLTAADWYQHGLNQA